MKLLDMIFNPRLVQRLEEFPCSICNKQFEFDTDSNKALNGFLDADTHQLVHKNMDCKNEHYRQKNMTKFVGLRSELPLTTDDLEVFAQIGTK